MKGLKTASRGDNSANNSAPSFQVQTLFPSLLTSFVYFVVRHTRQLVPQLGPSLSRRSIALRMTKLLLGRIGPQEIERTRWL